MICCEYTIFFVSALAYADDLVLVAPCSNAIRCVLQICDEYTAQFNVVFNANKSKCLHCHPHGIAKQVSRSGFTVLPFCIGSQVIEFVDNWPYLGHNISNNCADTDDILNKKHGLAGPIDKMLCNFRDVDCKIKIKLVKAYCTSLYGAELWNLSHNDIESISAEQYGVARLSAPGMDLKIAAPPLSLCSPHLVVRGVPLDQRSGVV